jgi:hypothetical protein
LITVIESRSPLTGEVVVGTAPCMNAEDIDGELARLSLESY